MADTAEETFRAADLIGSAGVGGNGERLVATLDWHYPQGLQEAQLRRENAVATANITDKNRSTVRSIAGIPSDVPVEVKVRGGERTLKDAWVTYAYIDERGDVTKGAMPFPALAAGSSDEHVSQRDSVMQSPAARDHLAAQEKARVAAPPEQAQDPYAALMAANAEDLVKQMRDHPERVDPIKAMEAATRGDKARATVMNFEPASSGDGSSS